MTAAQTTNNTELVRRKCAAQLFGLWAIVPDKLSNMVEAIRAGIIVPDVPSELQPDTPTVKPEPYTVAGGVAVIEINGPMTKVATSFQDSLGGTATTQTRRALRAAVDDDDVQSILLRIDSPGGTVAGTTDLAEDVRLARKHKRVYAQIDDLGASAAYWIASQAERVYANDTALIGSIGVRTVLEDSSGRAEAEGVKVHVIVTGKYKGAGVEGAPVTDDHIEYVQGMANDINDIFVAAVANGRGVEIDRVSKQWADGGVHIAAKAETMGMIDGIQTFDITLERMQKMGTMIDQFVADNPKTVADWKNEAHVEGHAEGVTEERERFAALKAAYGDRPQFVLEQFDKGNSVAQAAIDLTAVQQVELTERDKRVAELEKQASAGTAGVALPTDADNIPDPPADGDGKPSGDDPEALATWEWEQDESLHKRFSSKANYITIRKAEMSGTLRVSTRE